MPIRPCPLWMLCALLLAGGVARADDAAVAREIDAALLRLADRAALGPGEIRRPARTLYELGAVVDVRARDAGGLPVLAVTPGGAAERIGLRRGDRLLRINGLDIANAGKPADAYRQALASNQGRLAVGIRRNGRVLAMTGAADRIELPAYALSIAPGAPTSGVPGGCGRVSTMDVAPRGARRFPVVVISVDGRTPPSQGEVMRLPAGRHRLVLAERIDVDRFTTVQLRQREGLGRRGYKTLELDVAANTAYVLAAELRQPAGAAMASGGYWSPVIQSTTRSPCR